MTKLKYIGALVVVVSAFMSVNAVAADDDEAKSTTYFGGALGRTAWNINIDGAPGSTKRDNYLGFFIGEEFTKNIAVEGTFYWLGTSTITNDSPPPDSTNEYYSLLSGYYKGKGLDVSLVAKTNPYKKWRAFGKLGMTHVHGYTNAVIRNSQGKPIRGEKFEYNNAFTFGFGAMYQLTDRVNARLEFGKKDVIVAPDSPNTKTTVKNYTLGLQMYF
jgi:opacity protein-like surface antigen